jgi:hypothetical protein
VSIKELNTPYSITFLASSPLKRRPNYFLTLLPSTLTNSHACLDERFRALLSWGIFPRLYCNRMLLPYDRRKTIHSNLFPGPLADSPITPTFSVHIFLDPWRWMLTNTTVLPLNIVFAYSGSPCTQQRASPI